MSGSIINSPKPGPVTKRGSSLVARRPSPTVGILGWLVFVLSALGLLAGLAFFGYHHQPTEMGIAATACLLGMIVARLESFSEFSGLGIAAKLRNATQEAKDATEEAYVAIDRLNGAVKVLSEISLDSLATQGVWDGGPSLSYKLHVRDEIEDALRALGLDPAGFHLGARLDAVVKHLHAVKLSEALRNAAATSDDPVHRTALLNAHEQVERMYSWKDRHVASSAQLRAAVRKEKVDVKEIEQVIDELEFYESHRSLKHPEAWQ